VNAIELDRLAAFGQPGGKDLLALLRVGPFQQFPLVRRRSVERLDQQIFVETLVLPACLLVIDGKDITLREQADLAHSRILPELVPSANLAARVAPGASERAIGVTVEADRLRAYKLTAQQVQAALESALAPRFGGTARVGDVHMLTFPMARA